MRVMASSIPRCWWRSPTRPTAPPPPASTSSSPSASKLFPPSANAFDWRRSACVRRRGLPPHRDGAGLVCVRLDMDPHAREPGLADGREIPLDASDGWPDLEGIHVMLIE